MTTKDRQNILTLFGTITNALNRLGLQGELSYQRTRRVLLGETPADSDDAITLHDAWRAWCRQFLLSHILIRGDEEYNDFIVTQDEAGDIIEDTLRERVFANVKRMTR